MKFPWSFGHLVPHQQISSSAYTSYSEEKGGHSGHKCCDFELIKTDMETNELFMRHEGDIGQQNACVQNVCQKYLTVFDIDTFDC